MKVRIISPRSTCNDAVICDCISIKQLNSALATSKEIAHYLYIKEKSSVKRKYVLFPNKILLQAGQFKNHSELVLIGTFFVKALYPLT